MTTGPWEDPAATEAVIRGVQRLCDAGLDSRDLRRGVAARLAPVIGFAAYAFCTCDPDVGLISDVVAHGLSHGLAAAYVESVFPGFGDGRATYSAGPARMTEESPLASSEVAAGTDGRAGDDVDVHVALTARGRLWGTLWLARLRGGRAAADRAHALLSRLVPHLVRGVQAATRTVHEPTSMEATRDAEPGVLVLDERNRVVMRTPAASAWLEDLADVGLRMPDDLPLAVLGLAARARAAGSAAARGETHVRARGRSGRWYLLRVSLTEPRGGERATVVIVRPATTLEVASSLTRLHALSAREQEIVAAVARGDSTKEIAAALGLSPHTVCEHVERACQKLGVRGRKALVAKLFIGVEVATSDGARLAMRSPPGSRGLQLRHRTIRESRA